jgi:membrane-bound lytic murein transglycosylase
MQTLSIQIQDSYMQQFLDFVKESHSNITVTKDKNLELDPYFYERQKELHKIRADIKNGNIEMKSHEVFWGNIKNHLDTIEVK